MTATQVMGRDVVRSFTEHEHEEVRHGLERLRDLVADFPTTPVDHRALTVRRVLEWVDATLRPHMAWEESWLFPEIDARAHTPWATRLVRYDHQQIAAQTERLRRHAAGPTITSGQTTSVLIDLAGLETLIRANLEREERFLLPVLASEVDRWTSEWRD